MFEERIDDTIWYMFKLETKKGLYVMVSTPRAFNSVFGTIEEGALNRLNELFCTGYAWVCMVFQMAIHLFSSMFFVFYLIHCASEEIWWHWFPFYTSPFLANNVINFRLFIQANMYHAFIAFIFPSSVIGFTLLLLIHNFSSFILLSYRHSSIIFTELSDFLLL